MIWALIQMEMVLVYIILTIYSFCKIVLRATILIIIIKVYILRFLQLLQLLLEIEGILLSVELLLLICNEMLLIHDVKRCFVLNLA